MSKLPALLEPIAIGLIISTQLKCHQFKLIQVISTHASVRPTIRIKVSKFRFTKFCTIPRITVNANSCLAMHWSSSASTTHE